MRVIRNLVTALGVLVALVLLGSFLGMVHPAGDALAVIRPGLAAMLAVLALMSLALGVRRFGASALVAALLAGGPVIAGVAMQPADPGTVSVSLYSKNLWAGSRDVTPILADIRAADPDLVFLQEVSDNNRQVLGALSAIYPHQHLCTFSRWSGIAILSRWPLDETACSDHRTAAVARVATPEGPVWAGSVHLVWPYPHNQLRFLHAALPLFEQMQGRVVVAGDFNMVPWGYSVRQIAATTGAQRIGRVFGTYDLRGLPLPIDHVLTSGQGVTERRALLGSDHHGLVARIAF